LIRKEQNFMLEAQFFTPPATESLVLVDQNIISIAAYDGRVDALQTALGITLPHTLRSVSAGGAKYIWSGPDSWLVLAQDTAAIAAQAAPFAAVTEQSDGRAVFRLAGPHARETLQKLLPIDLHESTFPPDATALTIAAHIGVQLWRDETGGWYLACFRSYAKALHHALTEGNTSV
jgi:heterotetrameric sarcosine oxidase gamma subunit